MAIRSKSFDDMIREIIISLRTGEPKRPAFTLLVGSGFSYPIIPTPTQMLKGDIAWWRYSKDRKITDPFCSRAEGVSRGKATEEQIAEFEREMWKPIHKSALASKETAFGLTADGLPDLTTANAVGLAYQAVMSDGLLNNKMRRQYLRDAIQRSHPKVNGAHIFLAGILEAQETWDWGAPFCRTIFTTNFDPLLQRSLQLVNKLYYMTDRPDVLEPPDDDESNAIHLVYTHGSVHRYDLLNTEDQIKHARERNAPTLSEYFRHHGVIVIGYSGWADTTMDALSSCPSFDSNLYWCGMHPDTEAESRLRPEVLKILQAREKNAYYVEISGADEAMRVLHRELKLGDVPKFILSPVETMIAQLKSIDVPPDSGTSAEPEATPMSTSLATLLDATLTRLNVARSAFDNPSIVQPASPEGKEQVASALIAQLLSDAFVAYSQGKHENAIDLWSLVIDTPGVPAKDRATALNHRGITSGENGEMIAAIDDFTAAINIPDAPADLMTTALYNRGISWGESGEPVKAIDDYTAVIDVPDVSIHTKAKALVNRGMTWGQNGETTKEIADYTAVINITDAPADQKAKALVNRGITWGQNGDTTKEIADYTAVINMPDAPANQRAKALNNRGITWGLNGETTKEIADYTAIIDMTDAPADWKAIALNNRGLAWGENGATMAITDYTAVINLLDAPIDQRADALNNRGLAREIGESTQAIADYTAVIDMTGVSVDQKAAALNYRGITWGESGETTKEIADYTAIIDMPDAPADQKAAAFNNRGITWDTSDESMKAIADYTAVIDMPDAPADQKAAALNNRGLTRDIRESTKAIADYTAVIDMPSSPADEKARAFVNRGWTLFAHLDDAQAMVADSQKALELTEDDLTARSNLALGLLWTGNTEAALAQYEILLSRPSDATAIEEAIDDLETALRTRREIPEAEKILDRLRGATER